MKKTSLKTRLVLLHTGMMTVVICVVLGLLFSASSQEILSNVQHSLEERVSESFEYVEYRDGRLKFDSELLDLEDGVYLSVYEPDSYDMLYGKLPYGFPYHLSFADGQVRTTSSEEAEYYVLDMSFPVENYHTLMLRGIVSISDAERDFRYILYLALILSPVLILLTAVCGYLLTKRALLPVSQITKTVQNIQQEKDLSKRIQLGEGRDEIYTLAKTFDSLLDTIEEGVRREKQFSSDVSHELRTPLSVVLMQCEELLAHEDLSPESRAEVELIHQKVRSLSEMIAQLLLLSRADQGREKLQRERLDFSELSQMVVEEFQEIAEEKSITLEAQIEPGLYLTADQTLMIRMWNNLLENAVNYGKPAGHIWVWAGREGKQLSMKVADDGIGIAPEHLPHIWDRFYQADPSRNSNSSGLGLSMVKWIVEVHGGEIAVNSRLGEGTEFVCRFPLAEDAAN